ncbi:MAG: DNA-binding response regulator [Verrucomicrobia bacterium]|nr:MAG: DNA-binding response regulator [Verrucomicrobiota bacterium]
MPSENKPFASLSFLVLEDESLLRRRCTGFLEAQGADVTAVGLVGEARNALESIDFDGVLLDVNLPDGLGTDLLRDGVIPSASAVVIMTAEGGVSGAVDAIRMGASDYLTKPFDLEELPVRFMRARRARRAERAEEHKREQAGTESGFFFGRSLKPVETLIGKIVAADSRLSRFLPPVLIEGQTGTGKSTLARLIHNRGPRSKGPLIEVNCSALPESLAESELFGHERGAFTDAKEARIGLMEAADGGSLFLDELPSLSSPLQAKILTAIEDHAIRRVGSNKMVEVDVRIIAATNVDLRAAVAGGAFREDLFHRLDLFRLRIPPLKERGEEIVDLADRLIERTAGQYGLPVPGITPEGRRRLVGFDWPGNVRELSHEIERSLVFGEGGDLGFESLERDFPERTHGAGWLNAGYVFPESGFDLERAINMLVQRALEQSDGNVSAAARLLGVSRDYVRYRLKEKDG